MAIKLKGETKKAHQLILSFGYELVRWKTHLIYKRWDGAQITIPKTSSCWRSLRNLKSVLEMNEKKFAA